MGAAYTYRPTRALAFSGGLGAGYVFPLMNRPDDASSVSIAGQGMVHGLFGGAGAHSFESAAGVSVLTNPSVSDPASLLPSVFLGYRYQPLDGGVVVRSGLGWLYGGIGRSGSVGYAF